MIDGRVPDRPKNHRTTTEGGLLDPGNLLAPAEEHMSKPKQTESDEGSSIFNLNTLLAVVALVGGVFLVSGRLTSQRPSNSSDFPGRAIGDQTYDSRLWEDPMSAFQKMKASASETVGNFALLTDRLSSTFAKNENVHVVLATIPGGSYPEDRESRIRSRFAVISAVGEAGFAPEDAEHLGIASIPWPTSKEFTDTKHDCSTTCPAKQLHIVTNHTSEAFGILTSGRAQCMLAFEWFRPRVFATNSTQIERSRVLVIWVTDDLIEDYPLDRIALLASVLGLSANVSTNVRCSVLGPRSSSTLRAMLSGQYNGNTRAWPTNSQLALQAAAILKRIEFHSSTASAMDEVLVRGATDPVPRRTVQEQLETVVGKFYNYACTDAQLASTVLYELKQRGVDLAKTNEHMLLIGEWDTFYGRMLSLTYEAEVKKQQGAMSRRAYVEGVRQGKPCKPPNIRSFTYLRGLDGQSFSGGNPSVGVDPDSDKKRKLPRDISELATWTPDVNKAEGPAQMDYLSRLCERIDALERELKNGSGSRAIGAIGVVGSDIYDTLLILQALRPRFPSAIFFTTDLDARLWHPREFQWTRGLVVVSSYGLELSERYQRHIPPFRDSLQTAQYAAALTALQPQNDWHPAAGLSPRVFEVGRGNAVELSGPSSAAFHPSNERRLSVPLGLLGIFSVLGLVLVLLLFRPLRDLLLGRSLRTVCWVAEEDLGDWQMLLIRLGSSKDPLAVWLHETLQDWEKANGLHVTGFVQARIEKVNPDAAEENLRHTLEQETLGALINFLNDRLEEEWWAPVDILRHSRLLPRDRRIHYAGWRKWSRPLWHRAKNRRELNFFLDALQFEYTETDLDARFVTALTEDRDPLAKWLKRTAEMKGPLSVESLRETLNDRLFVYPWAPRDLILASDIPSRAAKDRYTWYAHFLRRLGVLSRPDLMRQRSETNELILHWGQERMSLKKKDDSSTPNLEYARAAAHSRKASNRIFRTLVYRMIGAYALLTAFALAAFPMLREAWDETRFPSRGEPFSLVSGISSWPTEFMRLLAIALALCFLIDSYSSLRVGGLEIARRFRLAVADDSPRWFVAFTNWPVHRSRANASWIWETYQQMGGFWKRMRRTVILAAIYLICGLLLMRIEGFPSSPIRGEFLLRWNHLILVCSVATFLLITFWTIDAALLCRWFIEHLSLRPTDYPLATLNHFKLQNGNVEPGLLDEWIDTRLIAGLTERIGRLVYYPAVVLLILILSRNSWWDTWPWPKALMLIFAVNFILALTSVVILQKSAVKARRRGIESLDSKLRSLRPTFQSRPEAQFHLVEGLLEDLRKERRGAFVPVWQNPALGALLVPSGGLAIFELLLHFWGR